ncbi:MAG TPA: AmmeMemoRadiSam system protein A [Acidimicrobiia bacterium]|nr:AmmeMemoRadiSam system protein A [Acidimicrobiia bacterium]
MTHPLCHIAVDAIAGVLRDGERREPDLTMLHPTFTDTGASFVTLEREGQLLGCVGSLEPRRPLALDVAQHAIEAAFDDPRVPPITPEDFKAMSVKVSVLSRSEPIAANSFADLRVRVRPGVDGITVTAASRRATFLPSVWDKVRDVDEFLGALWLKAGLRPGTWPAGMTVERYTTTEFTDRGPRDF